jgi:hypothetical protein
VGIGENFAALSGDSTESEQVTIGTDRDIHLTSQDLNWSEKEDEVA